MRTNLHKKILRFFLHFGKIKGGLLYFLFCIVIGAVYFILFALIDRLFNKNDSLAIIWDKNSLFIFFYIIAITLNSWNFYDDALKRLKVYEDLEKSGLSLKDLKRIAFVKEWAETRKTGALRYCIYNGGLITGMMLFLPISFLLFITSGYSLRLFPEFSDMMFFIAKGLVLGYLIGSIIYRIRWTWNEHIFIRLTDPIS